MCVNSEDDDMGDEIGNAFMLCFGFKGVRNNVFSNKICKKCTHAPKKHVCKLHFKTPRECVKVVEKGESDA